MEAFHFLAAPAPACASKCVALISRRLSGTFAQVSQSQMTRLCRTKKVPCRKCSLDQRACLSKQLMLPEMCYARRRDV